MTSEFTLEPTAKFFQEHDFFHLDPDNVIMFEQRMLPAVTFDGRAILERKDKVAMAPGTIQPSQLRMPSLPGCGARLGSKACPWQLVWKALGSGSERKKKGL